MIELIARLDRQFKAIQEFIGDLTFAPIDALNPTSILELGYVVLTSFRKVSLTIRIRSGTGAWAAEAADKFPKASIMSVDISSPSPE